mmetsp:Transcript_6099/g.25277  ORF Transcript_6099/g.25277 Transcript_6099/m.25277 type:complete len:206 (-) Transcript_6099:1785-2402(-)
MDGVADEAISDPWFRDTGESGSRGGIPRRRFSSASSSLSAAASASARAALDLVVSSSPLHLATAAMAASLDPPPPVAFTFALPSSTWEHRCANSRVDCVSGSDAASGETCARSTTLELPPNESDKSLVSCELRNGTCVRFSSSAAMTSPRALRLLLMCCASLSLSPVASDLATRSDPARSIRCSLPVLTALIAASEPSTYTVTTE